ncbi:MAG: putative oxidoreductase CzcO [candidate division BRC1 bacterium ADurb.BinA364]|nr:MAG: putative oxidoreductase CzcO [candidate division BRC1 bacterium ADurb.BinA364]
MKRNGMGKTVDVAIVGAGPIGLACAIEARRRGLRCLVLEKGCLVNSIYRYPRNMRFFSTPDLLELGGAPFVCQGEKPTRAEALEYYRRIAISFDLPVRCYEKVLAIEGEDGAFRLRTDKGAYGARKAILAIGYFDRPRLLGVPGENLPHVSHYYEEAHPFCGQDLLIVGGGNSAVDAALECRRRGARVALAIRDADFHRGLKYWVRPDIENRIRAGEIECHFETTVREFRPGAATLESRERGLFERKADFVLALTGYEPDFGFLQAAGVRIGKDKDRTPRASKKTWETNRPGVHLAGVVVGGMCTDKWFIENSRAHARAIFDSFG